MLFFNFVLSFSQKYSTFHALIHLTDKTRGQLNSGNLACGIFVDRQKPFDTEDHDIFIKKLNYYHIRIVPKN